MTDLHRLARPFLTRLALALGLSLALAVGAAACMKLSPAAESALEGAFALACPLESAVPVVGSTLATACPGEEAIVKAALDKVAAQPVASAVAATDAGAAPVALLRLSDTGQLVHCGYAQADVAPAVQRALFAAPTSPAPASSSSSSAKASSSSSSSGAR